MAGSDADGEEVSMAEAARRLGMTAQGVGMWAQRPDAPVVTKAGRRYCLWPKFPVWHREQIARPSEPTDIEDAKRRKLAAEAELAELDLAVKRAQLVTVDEQREVMQEITRTLRAQILAFPGRFAARAVGLTSLVQAQTALDAIARDFLRGLASGDGD